MLSSLFHRVAKSFPSCSFKGDSCNCVHNTMCLSNTIYKQNPNRTSLTIVLRLQGTPCDAYANRLESHLQPKRTSKCPQRTMNSSVYADRNTVYDGWLSLLLYVDFSYFAKKRSLICLVDVIIFCPTACSYFVG